MIDPLTVLFEDNHCLVVSKPPCLLTQGVPAGIPTLETMAKAYLKERYHKPGNVYLGIPHRLDRPVSGVVVFARNTKAAQRLAEQFQNRQVRKVYWALVEGKAPTQSDQWSDWLLKLPDEARSTIATETTPRAKQAVLTYRTLQIVDDVSWLEITPETGRMHQIRIQAGSRGHSVLGDVLYGSNRPFGPAVNLPRDRAIALHARSLTFLHPIRYDSLTIRAPLPPFWHESRFDFSSADADWKLREASRSVTKAIEP